jgi:hypothetical protein
MFNQSFFLRPGNGDDLAIVHGKQTLVPVQWFYMIAVDDVLAMYLQGMLFFQHFLHVFLRFCHQEISDAALKHSIVGRYSCV